MERARILVTGGAGFMGSSFIRLLEGDPAFKGEIINLDAMTYAGSRKNLEGLKCKFVEGNICDQTLVEGLVENVDIVVHFAAESHVDRSIASAEDFVQTNVMGTFRLLEAVRRFPHVHFHHVSTDEVYGSIKEGSFVETSPYKPNSPYAASKAASDHFVRSFAKTYGLSVTLSHSSNNYGPGQFPEKFIPVMIHALMKKKPLPVYGQGVNVRDWLYVDDHARAVRLILEKGRKGEMYNISAHNPRRNIDVLHLLIRIYERMSGEKDLKELIAFVDDRPGHDLRYALCADKLQNELGWQPEVDFEEGLKETICWYQDAQKQVDRLCHSR